MKTRAALHVGLGEPLEVAEVDLEGPKAGEVMLRVAACGVCHSDLSAQNGTLPIAPPAVLGHEGAGIIEALGPGVEGLALGDHVVVAWIPQCGECYMCERGQPELCETSLTATLTSTLLDGTSRFSRDGAPIGQGATTGCFSEYTTVPAMSAVKIDESVPLELAALIGCGVLTGVGAVRNTAGVEPGASVAVIGAGGVGLSVIQGARIAGASQIIAVDVVESKLDLARKLGATDVVDASAGDPVQAVNALTGTTPVGMPRGVDYAFEVVGSSATFEQALNMTRRGGTTVLVGVPRADDLMTVSLFLTLFVGEKRVLGCVYGSSDVRRDIPDLIGLYQSGDLDLDSMVTEKITLDGVNDAFEAMKNGDTARSVIVFDH